MAKTNNNARNAGEPTVWDKVKDFINTGRQYQVQALENMPRYYSNWVKENDRAKWNRYITREANAPQPTTQGSMSCSGDPEIDGYLQDIKTKADKAVYDPRPAEKPAIFNEAKNFVNTAFDKTKDFINTGRQYQVQALEDMADYYKENASNPNKDDTWFQDGAFSDGWQREDLRNAAKATLADLNMNTISGALRLGENAADSTRMLGAWSYGGLMPSEEMSIYPVYRFSVGARDAEKQRATEFVAKDLIDEDAIAETIYADYFARNADLDVGRDSILGTKSRALAKEAGELAAISALQAVGVPWWLTTGVAAFGNETENAARGGANFDEAAISGLVSAGTEIICEALLKGMKYNGQSLSDRVVQKISTFISDDFVNSAISFGVKSLGGGAENAVIWAMGKFGQWLTYQDEETLRELLTSDEARKELSTAFWSGLLMKGMPGAVDSVFGKKDIVVQPYYRDKGRFTPHLPPHD